MTTLTDDTTTTDPIEALVSAALVATADYMSLVDRHVGNGPLPFADEVKAACTTLYISAGEILGTELLAASRKVRLASAALSSVPDFSYEEETNYINASVALWMILMAEVGETLPRVTIRASLLGMRGDTTAIVLFHEPDGRLTYRRVNDQSVFCGPGTKDQLRDALRHPGWKP